MVCEPWDADLRLPLGPAPPPLVMAPDLIWVLRSGDMRRQMWCEM